MGACMVKYFGCADDEEEDPNQQYKRIKDDASNQLEQQRKYNKRSYTSSYQPDEQDDIGSPVMSSSINEENQNLVEDINQYKPLQTKSKKGFLRYVRLSEIQEEDEQNRESEMSYKRGFSKMKTKNGSQQDQDNPQYEKQISLDDQIVMCREECETKDMKSIISELVDYSFQRESINKQREGLNIEEVLPDYESLSKNALSRFLEIISQDNQLNGFTIEHNQNEQYAYSFKDFQVLFRNSLFEAKEKQIIQMDKQKTNVEHHNNNINSSSTSIQKDQGSSNNQNILDVLLEQTLAKNKELDSNNVDMTNSTDAISRIEDEDLVRIDSNIENGESSQNEEPNVQIHQRQTINLNISINEIGTISPDVPKSDKNEFYSRLQVKNASSDKYKYFLLLNEYNVFGCTALEFANLGIDEQWSKKNNESIDIFESIGIMDDFRLIYIAYKKILLASPRDFLYLRICKQLAEHVYVSLQLSVELKERPPIQGKERAIVTLGGTLIIQSQEQKKLTELDIVNYSESNLKLTINHKIMVKPTVSEAKKYILRQQQLLLQRYNELSLN